MQLNLSRADTVLSELWCPLMEVSALQRESRLNRRTFSSFTYCPSYSGVRFIMCPSYRDFTVNPK